MPPVSSRSTTRVILIALTLLVVLGGCSNGNDHFNTITGIPLLPSALRDG
jgi:hypothetical protein